MSTSFATSPDSGLSGPHTPSRTLAPPAKSSPVGKVCKYSQYQKFGIEETFLRGDFDKYPDSHSYQGTPLFIARAVELGGPVPLRPRVAATIPGVPNCPDIYAKAHPD